MTIMDTTHNKQTTQDRGLLQWRSGNQSRASARCASWTHITLEVCSQLNIKGKFHCTISKPKCCRTLHADLQGFSYFFLIFIPVLSFSNNLNDIFLLSLFINISCFSLTEAILPRGLEKNPRRP